MIQAEDLVEDAQPFQQPANLASSSASSSRSSGLSLTASDIRRLFHLRQTEAAQVLGISLTALKRACRRAGALCWLVGRARARMIELSFVPYRSAATAAMYAHARTHTHPPEFVGVQGYAFCRKWHHVCRCPRPCPCPCPCAFVLKCISTEHLGVQKWPYVYMCVCERVCIHRTRRRAKVALFAATTCVR